MVNNKIANLTVLNLTIARHEFERDTTMQTRDIFKKSISRGLDNTP